jgi:hypothetical protein
MQLSRQNHRQKHVLEHRIGAAQEAVTKWQLRKQHLEQDVFGVWK